MRIRKTEFFAAAVLFTSAYTVLPSVSSAQQSTVGDTMPINGMQMYYETVGVGPPLLLLHYFGGCTRSWGRYEVDDDLAHSHRLIIADMRGHGRSTNPSDDFTHRQSARDVLALLDSLDIGRVKAIGSSSGAMTLLHMATQQPERIEAMVLEAGTSYFPEEARALMRQDNPDEMTEAELARARWENGGCSSRGDGQTRSLGEQFHMRFPTPSAKRCWLS